jgi:hypothetical protein
LAFWEGVFGSAEVGTRCRDPRTGEILYNGIDRFYELVTVRFCRLLSFHLYFQLRLLLAALKMGVFG